MSLKTLYNIVEDRFKKLLNFGVYIMMFRWINKQPGMQKFWKCCSHYHLIYEYHLINSQTYLSFILTLQSIGENEYGKSGHLSIFALEEL